MSSATSIFSNIGFNIGFNAMPIKDDEKRRAYFREYMRQRRAEKDKPKPTDDELNELARKFHEASKLSTRHWRWSVRVTRRSSYRLSYQLHTDLNRDWKARPNLFELAFAICARTFRNAVRESTRHLCGPLASNFFWIFGLKPPTQLSG